MQKNIPKLRFPEFNNEWEEKRLGNLLNIDRGASPRPIQSYISKSDEGTPWIKIGDVPEGSKYITKTKEKINSDGVRASRKVNIGDFILSNSMSFGRPYVLKINGCIHDGWLALKNIDKTELSDDFLYVVLSSTKVRKKFLSLAAGSAVKNLKSETVKTTRIHIPKLAEQQKIAEYLGSVDDWINNSKKQKENLEKYKKGLMQKIFSQEVRFKDENGKEYKPWIKKQLNDVFNYKKGFGLSKNQIVKGGVNKCVLYGELYTLYSEVIKEVISRTHTTTGVRSKIGDLLIPRSTTTTAIDLAHATELNEEGVLLGGDITILRFKNSGNSTFFSYYLTNYKKLEIAKYGQGSTIVHLYYSHFSNILIDLPEEREQQKIADFLISMDKIIESKQQQIALAESWKKGLMQRMFI